MLGACTAVNRPRTHLIATTVICVLAVLGIGGCADPPPFEEGSCVHLSSTEPMQPVSCDGPGADRQIVRVVSGASGMHLCDNIPRAIPYTYSSARYGYYAMCLIPRGPTVSR